MASGSFGVSTSNGYISGSVTWQEQNTNTTNNTSDVYVEMRLSRTNTGYTTTGSGTFHINVNGTDIANSPSFSLTYNSNTLMVSGTVTVAHNSDGTKAITISWSGSSNVFTVNSGSGTATLSTIPRSSTISSAVSWTVGTQNLAVSLSVADSSFHHTLTVQVINGAGTAHNICTRTNIGSSTTIVFTQSENTDLYTWLAQNSSITVKLYCDTYDSSNNTIGSQTNKSGTAYAVSATKGTLPDFNIGTTPTISLNPASNDFNHKIEFSFGNYNPTIATGVTGTSYSWNQANIDSATNDTYANGLYKQIPNDNSGWGTLKVTTYYNGVQVQQPVNTSPVNAYVVSSNPTFNSGSATYKDTNTTNPSAFGGTVGLTGDNTKIVQNKSTVTVTIPVANKATAVNFATMSQYIVNLNGVEKTASWSSSADVNIDFGTVSASSDVTLLVKAVDSRGNNTIITKTVTIIPYANPTVNATSKRTDGFSDSTTLTMNGAISLLTIGGVNKNSVQSVQYRYKDTTVSTATTWDTWTNFTYSTSSATYTATNVSLTLDNTKSWNVEFKVADKFGNITVAQIVATGTPIMFIDSVEKSVGVGKFPTGTGTFETAGDAIIGGNLSVNNKAYVTELTATIPATAGWYRVATSASGIANNMAEFEILAPLSSHHSTSKVMASINYANSSYTGYTSLNQINHSVYNTNTSGAVTQVRLVYNTTYSGNYAYLEVYCPNASSFSMTVRMIGGTGWSLLTPNTAGSVPSGYTSSTITLQASGIVTSGKVAENGSELISPTGLVNMFAGTTAPNGWLICDGSQVSRTTYSKLFSAIGTAYGAGDGSTTFNLPNLCGRTPVGVYSGDTDFNAVGKTGGEKTHTLTTSEMPTHSHQTTANGGYYVFGGTGGNPAQGTGYGTQTSTLRTDNQGGGTAHNNMQPYTVINFIIRT